MNQKFKVIYYQTKSFSKPRVVLISVYTSNTIFVTRLYNHDYTDLGYT